jgi:hypothetical protein
VDKDKLLYLFSVIAALALFAPSALILPTIEDKSTLTYQLLFFGCTLSAVVLFFFAANLIIDGLKKESIPSSGSSYGCFAIVTSGDPASYGILLFSVSMG